MTTLVSNLEELLEPTIMAMGYQLWGIEYLTRGKGCTLRLFIDSENGIDIEDCAAVSRQVSGILDVEDPIPAEYNLEVSSPGMDRPLFKEEQYEQYCGQIVKLKLSSPIDGRRNFTGRLMGVDGGNVLLRLEEPSAQTDPKHKSASKKGGTSAVGVAESAEGDAEKVTIGLWQVSRGQVIPQFD